MTSAEWIQGLPKPVRRIVNLLRRLSILSPLLGERPIEPGIKRLYSHYINKNDVVLEVGARMGDGTRLLADISKHVYSFEPARQNFLALKTLTRTRRNVEAYNIALGDNSGEAYLNKDRSFSQGGSLKKLANVEYVDREIVRVSPLDQLKFKLSPTSLVVDCEGSEYEVLKGGSSLLPKLRTVLVETHILSNGSTTRDPVVEELAKFFPSVKIEESGRDCWVIAQRRKLANARKMLGERSSGNHAS